MSDMNDMNDDRDDQDAAFDEEASPDEEFALDLLEEELRQATAILDPVPPALRQIAVEAFALHDLDSRIAELSFDSVVDALPVRGATGAPRMLTFHAGEVTVDVELTPQGLMGQVLPPQSARIEVLSGPQAGSPLTTDDMGRFLYEPSPAGPFALRLRTGEGVIVTDWITV
ncbi:hypothetical protein [Streptomyces sp. NPDC050759]|uniref:hypothetical protein n=1 Tax=Streptomyces sp. NPDC050759 TaxID=3365635 RepID=UPI00379DE21D